MRIFWLMYNNDETIVKSLDIYLEIEFSIVTIKFKEKLFRF